MACERYGLCQCARVELHLERARFFLLTGFASNVSFSTENLLGGSTGLDLLFVAGYDNAVKIIGALNEYLYAKSLQNSMFLSCSAFARSSSFMSPCCMLMLLVRHGIGSSKPMVLGNLRLFATLCLAILPH